MLQCLVTRSEMFVLSRLSICPRFIPIRVSNCQRLLIGSALRKLRPITSGINHRIGAKEFSTSGIMSSLPKVLVTRGDIPDVGLNLLRSKCELVVWEDLSPIPRSELLNKIVGVSAVYCLLTDNIDDEILAAAGSQLKVIGTMSVGYDHLDIASLKARGIRVGYTPGVLTDATCELTIALLLATARRFFEADKAIRAGEWKAWSPSFMCGTRVAGSSVGIVGLGALGARVAEYLKVFRVGKIMYTSRSDKKDIASKFDGERVSLDRLLDESDFVVVTTALTPETREMFNADAFRKMKKTAIFINVSRGPVVDQEALIDALKNGTIRAAGLDVMTPEPIPLDSELLKLENCVVMPHLGSATIETRQEMARLTAMNILAVLNGEPEKMPAELDLKTL